MKNSLLIIILLPAFILLNACKEEPAGPTFDTTEYKNDAWISGGTAAFQQGFLSSERAGVTIGPIGETFIINQVVFLFGGSAETKDVVVKIYWEVGTVKPGELVYQGTHSITGNDAELQKINLRDKELTFHSGGSCRVVIEFMHDGLPSVARDDDGVFTKTKNWVYTNNNWVGSDLVGLKDDFVIRATIDTKQ